jgi:hypothetical protein
MRTNADYTEGFGLEEGSDGSYPFAFGEGLDFAANLAIDTIDFGTFHLYPGSCTSPHPSLHKLPITTSRN